MHLTLALLLGALASSSPSAAAPEPAEPLLLELQIDANLPVQGPVLRQRTIAVRTELLADAAAHGGRLALEPFPGERFELTDVRVEPAYADGRVYLGRLHDTEGNTIGSATVSVVEEAVVASLRLDHRLLRIEAAGSGAHRILEIDESRMPTCGTGHEHLVPPPEATEEPDGPALGSPKATGFTNYPTIDVLVAYTPQARAGQGGTNAMLALINLAVIESNTGYNNSDVNQRYRMVYAFEAVGYTESGNFSTDLNRFRNSGDGYIDEVHTLRNQYGADACCLILNGSQYCGVAYGVMSAPTLSWGVNAFQVTARTCATGYYSFSHEFGHLFGSHHDKANAGVAYYPYGYGWRTANGAWRTVMAYAPGTRVNYWSNPGKTYGGQALGSAGVAENYRSLNNNAPVTSQWRCAVPENYCTGKINSAFGYPTLGWSGKPVADGSGNFQVQMHDAIPNKLALIYYGPGTDASPFHGGTLCVAPPITRLAAQPTDGSGSASWAFPIAQFAPGDEIYIQGWFRDPDHWDGTGMGLTDALRVDVCQYNN